MSGEVGSAFVRIRPSFTGFKSATQQGVKRSLSGDIFSGLALGAKGATLGIGAMGAAIGVAGFKFDQMRAQAQIAFTTMLGSGQKATAMLDELQKFAAATPFEFKDLTINSQRLLAMGFTAKQIIPTLTAVGNAAAAMGGSPETIERVTTAMGQIKAKGKLAAEEMRQLTEAGIPAWKMLADHIGKSVPEAMKLVTKGAIGSNTAISALVDGMNKKYDGMMDKQSHTFAGLWSTVKDTFSQITGTVMQPFFDMATKGLQRLVDVISTPEFAAGAKRIGDSLRVYIGEAIAWLQAFWDAHWRDMLAVAKLVWESIKIGWTVLREGVQYIDRVAKAFGGWRPFMEAVVAGFAAMKTAMFGFMLYTRVQAAITAGTMRAALISTGIGAIAVAIGVGTVLIIQHFDTIKKWFIDFGHWLSTHAKLLLAVPVIGQALFMAVEVVKHFNSIKKGIVNVGAFIAKKAIEMALAFIEPFSHIPKWLGGGWAQDAKKSLQSALDGMSRTAAVGGSNIGTALGSNMLTATTPYFTQIAGNMATLGAGVGAKIAGMQTGAFTGSKQALPHGQMSAYIRSQASKYGLDPDALIAVANQEGLGGGIGDFGHAFGPFQLNNAGGVLTGMFKGSSPQQIQAWAQSTEGVAFALSHIQKVAAGLKGSDAVKAIVYNFERPADKAGEYARALRTLGVSVIPQTTKAAVDMTNVFGKDLPSALDTTTKKAKKVALASDAVKENLATSFRRLVVSAAKLGDDATPGIKKSIVKIKAELGKVVTAKDASNVRAHMGTLREAITEQLTKVQQAAAKRIAAIKAQVSSLRTSFDGMFGRLSSGFDSAFDRATQKAKDAMQVMVQMASGSFLFGGGITETPSEKALREMHDAHDAAGRSQRVINANAAIAKGQADLAAAETEDDKKSANDAIVQAQQELVDAQYDITDAALQKQAQLERDAASQTLSDAQDAYQAQRDLLKLQMDDRVEAIKVGMENGNISAKSGRDQLLAILNDPTYALDLRNSGLVIGGTIYDGLKEGFAPVFALLDELIAKMKQAGLPTSSSSGGTSGHVAANSNKSAAANFMLNGSLTPAQIADALKIANKDVVDAIVKIPKGVYVNGGSAAAFAAMR